MTARYRHQLSLSFFHLAILSAGLLNLAECSSAMAAARMALNQQDGSATSEQSKPQTKVESTDDWNRRLQARSAAGDPALAVRSPEYTIGPEDVLEVSVFEAQEMNREVRVAANGEISLPLLGPVEAAGLTPRELEMKLEELLRQSYLKDPHVGVFVREMQSHPVSVVGAVRKPGIYQIRGTKTLLEILSLAEGLAEDAGEDIIILRDASQKTATESSFAQPTGEEQPVSATHQPAAGDQTMMSAAKPVSPPQTVLRVNLKDLLDSTDPGHNPLVFAGDIVKVSRAGIVYVVGAVRQPGGFAMKNNEKISVLQAIALSEGLTNTAARGNARIIRTSESNGTRSETPIDLGKILSGKAPDPMLAPRDIVFVPDSAAKTTLSRGVEAAAQTLTGLLIFHW